MKKEEFKELYVEYISNGFDKMEFELKDGSTLMHNDKSVVNFSEYYFALINEGFVATVPYSYVDCVAI